MQPIINEKLHQELIKKQDDDLPAKLLYISLFIHISDFVTVAPIATTRGAIVTNFNLGWVEQSQQNLYLLVEDIDLVFNYQGVEDRLNFCIFI